MEPVGVLALQGGFAAHARALEAIGFGAVEIRRPAELQNTAGLVLPGGESSTMLKLLEATGLDRAIVAFAGSGRPILATCAGLILIARRVSDPAQRCLGLLDVDVSRNAWGRQRESFASEEGGRRLIFIRAPRIRTCGPGVSVEASFRGEPVLVRSGRIYGACFHPELTGDAWLHAAAFG